jgi:DNA-binding response OmpR family regulator
VRVLVVEDDFAVANLMRHAFEKDGHDAAIAADGAVGLQLLETWQPDLVLLDLTLPDVDGRDVLRTIRATDAVPVIVVTGRGEELDRVLGLEMGSDDYIVKPFSIVELIARSRAVLRRTNGMQPCRTDNLAHLDLSMDLATRRFTRESTDVALTKREFEVMRCLLAEPGKLVSRSDLARAVWGMSAKQASRSIDVCVSSIRDKLGEDPKKPRYIETVHGVGYRLARSQKVDRLRSA